MAKRKLIIQIPCYNEEQTLAITLNHLPRDVPGFDKVEWLIVDDGSTDQTVEVARANGVDHIVSMRHNQGLARGFMAGLEASLKMGADVIVNTDADNQYDASCIPDLVGPIIRGEADIVVGERPISEIQHFSPTKKILQRVGSWAVRVASKTNIPDAPSGFRAIHREAALRLYVYSDYTYTLETIIQAGRKNMRIVSVSIRTNADLRPSRLVKSISSYVRRSVLTIIRIFLIYKPMRAFVGLGLILSVLTTIIGGRFTLAYLAGEGAGHVQSLILTSILAVGALMSFTIAVIADLMAMNRSLLEDLRTRMLRAEIENFQSTHQSNLSPFKKAGNA